MVGDSNVLSQALRSDCEQAGAARILFGLTYYLCLGMLLGLAGMVQQLGFVLTVCALLVVLMIWFLKHKY